MLKYRINPAIGVVTFEGKQVGEVEEFAAVLRQAVSDRAFRRGFGFLRDLRDRPVIAASTLRRYVAALRPIMERAPGRWAFVVRDPATYGMVRVAEILFQGSFTEVAVFDDMKPALDWLKNRPPEPLA